MDDKTIRLQHNRGRFNPCKDATRITLFNTPARFIDDKKNLFLYINRLTVTNVEVVGSAVILPETITERTLVTLQFH